MPEHTHLFWFGRKVESNSLGNLIHLANEYKWSKDFSLQFQDILIIWFGNFAH